MTNSNPTGFCPRCKQQVLLTRKEFETCLAIFLLIFTVIGFFIYLGVYFSRKEDRCTHCGMQINISHSHTQIQPQASAAQVITSGEVKGFLPKFCSLCGEKLEPGIRFCPNCGSKITEEG